MAAIPNITYSPGQPMQDFFDIVNQTIDAVNAITNTNDIACKVLAIGAYNMQGGTDKAIAHGLSDITKITSVTISIRNDAGTSIRDLSGTVALGAGEEDNAGAWNADSSNINIDAFAGGSFDSVNYNDAVINRGYITIFYKK